MSMMLNRKEVCLFITLDVFHDEIRCGLGKRHVQRVRKTIANSIY